MTKTCAECAYWCAHTPGRKSGDCRRHAPGPMYSLAGDEPGIIWWPKTRNTFWCGDFLQREQPTEQERLLQQSVCDLEVSTRVASVIRSENCETLGDIVNRSEREWLRTPNFGRRSLNDLKNALAQYNLALSAY